MFLVIQALHESDISHGVFCKDAGYDLVCTEWSNFMYYSPQFPLKTDKQDDRVKDLGSS